MKGITVNVPYAEKSPRMELLWRLGYAIVYGVIASVFSAVAGICWFVQIVVVLLLGKKIEILNKIMQSFLKWTTEFTAYFYVVTDERPEIMPKL